MGLGDVAQFFSEVIKLFFLLLPYENEVFVELFIILW